jgi:hypothetical protein
MSDIVERLERGLYCPERGRHEPDDMLEEAADTIATLRAEIERLRAALEPFANALKGNWSHQGGSMKIVAGPHAHDLRLELTLYDFRRAALAQEKPNDR